MPPHGDRGLVPGSVGSRTRAVGLGEGGVWSSGVGGSTGVFGDTLPWLMIVRVRRITAAVRAVALRALNTVELSPLPMIMSAHALRPSVGFRRRVCEMTRWIPELSPEAVTELGFAASDFGISAAASIVVIVLSEVAGVGVSFLGEWGAYRRYTTASITMMAVAVRIAGIMAAVSSCA